MPRVSVWLVRTSLCYLVAGFAIGAWLLAQKGISSIPGSGQLRDIHIEVLLMGWLVQLVMGVAVWIFPRFALRRPSQRSMATAWLAFALLNAGVVLVAAGAVATGRIVEVGAAGSVVVHLWGRASPAGLSQM